MTATATKTIRYAVRCRICKQHWTEEVSWFSKVGLNHPCWLSYPYYKPNDYPAMWNFLVLNEIQGKYKAEIPCDGRCWNAIGHKCECSCSGHNHGRGNQL